jgi:2-keto-3-deoxy-6-phosphogluconate aldolase
MLTGGLDATEANVREWIKASAAALGGSSKLITAQAGKEKDYEGTAMQVCPNVLIGSRRRGKSKRKWCV